MIDEFPTLGKLEILQQSLAFVAAYGIKCYLISQDINQLKSRETGYGPDETITSNCHVQAAFPPNRLETAEHLSKLTGQTTNHQRAGYSIWTGSRDSRLYDDAGSATASPHARRVSSDARATKGRTLTALLQRVTWWSTAPASRQFTARQPLYFEDRIFAARAAIPLPKRSVSATSSTWFQWGFVNSKRKTGNRRISQFFLRMA